MDTTKNESNMRWAIALSLEGMGRTSPNPMVGAVIVKDDKVVGEGYHRMAGTPHAEIHALNGAGDEARGADMYVTLEPCCHEGRTPPCVDAIVKAGIKRIFIGTRDLNPVVRGRGIKHLKDLGVEVIEGVLEDSCRKVNESYNKFIVSGIPFVTAKVAMSLDGKIATSTGDSKWVTSAECRSYVHRMRSHVDAVLVGGGTVRKDDPRLTVRMEGWSGKQPKAIIVDEALNFPRKSRLVKRRKGQSIFVTTNKAPKSRRTFLERQGHDVVLCRSTTKGMVSLPHMLRELGKKNIISLLVEGGGEIFSDFIKRGLVDRLVICVAPKLIGGEGRDFLPGMTIKKVKEALKLRGINIQTFGDNIVVEGRLR